MGSGFSSSSSYNQYKNDFELVIRATKDLEHLLETQFDAPSGKNVGLHDKVNASILIIIVMYPSMESQWMHSPSVNFSWQYVTR